MPKKSKSKKSKKSTKTGGILGKLMAVREKKIASNLADALGFDGVAQTLDKFGFGKPRRKRKRASKRKRKRRSQQHGGSFIGDILGGIGSVLTPTLGGLTMGLKGLGTQRGGSYRPFQQTMGMANGLPVRNVFHQRQQVGNGFLGLPIGLL